MITLQEYHSEEELIDLSRNDIINFLHTHLDRFRDTKEAIGKCLDYAFSKKNGKGGFVLVGYYNQEIAGIVVMNRTGMEGYIPENILVYIAVNATLRGKGIGGKMMQEAISRTQGDIKLHVEYDNPAKRLYERIGFTTKYAEMRFIKKKE